VGGGVANVVGTYADNATVSVVTSRLGGVSKLFAVIQAGVNSGATSQATAGNTDRAGQQDRRQPKPALRARDTGAQHIEFVLLDDLGSAERRFHARSNDLRLAEHQRVAAAFIEEAGGYAHEYVRLARCLADRDLVEIRSAEGDPDATYRAVLAHL
jgi:hypothetical protein